MQRSPSRSSPGPNDGLASVRPLHAHHGDDEIVDGLRAALPWARAALFDRYGRDVERVLAWVMGVDHELPDLLHDVFVQAYEDVGSLRDAARLRPWLVSIAVFTARGCIRKRQRRALLRVLIPWQEWTAEDVWSMAEASEEVRATRSVLQQLKTEDRIVFTLRFIGQLELTEIAEACGSSLGTVKRRLAHARSRFDSLAASDPVLRNRREGAAR